LEPIKEKNGKKEPSSNRLVERQREEVKVEKKQETVI